MATSEWIETEAIILAGRDLDGADRLLWLFTREMGLVQAVAAGARRGRNSWSGILQPYAIIQASLQPGSWYRLKQCDLLEAYRPIQQELTKQAYAAFVCELTRHIFPERQKDEAVYDRIEAIFAAFEHKNPRVVAQAAAWQLLDLAGLAPQLQHCASCGQAFSLPVAFSSAQGGVLCRLCCGKDELDLDESALQLFETFLQLNFRDPPTFSVAGKDLLLLEKILFQYIDYHVGEPFRSLEFIQQIAAK